MVRASGCSSTPHWGRNGILDLQRALSMKTSVKNGKICNQMRMGERLERICEVCVVNETDRFRLDFIKKTWRRFRSITPDMGAVLKRK